MLERNKDQNKTANNIVDFIDLYLITIWLNMHETLSFCKKKTAHAYFGRLCFFLSFWRENYAILNRCYLQSFMNQKKSACVFWAPVFSKFFGGKTKFFSNSCYRKKPRTLEKVFFDLLFKLDF